MTIYSRINVGFDILRENEEELQEEDSNALVRAVESLCRLGLSSALMRNEMFAKFLISPPNWAVKQRLFRTVCHDVYKV